MNKENIPKTEIKLIPMNSIVFQMNTIIVLNADAKETINFPWWLSGKESADPRRRCRFDPWVRKIPWKRKWQPTPVFAQLHSTHTLWELVMNREAWHTVVHGVAKTWTELSD